MVGHGGTALRELGGVLLRWEEDPALARLLRDARGKVPAVDEKVRIGDPHEIAVRLRAVLILAQVRLLQCDELSPVDGDHLVDRKIAHRKQPAAHRVLTDHLLHPRSADLAIAARHGRKSLPDVLVSHLGH